MKLYKFYLDRFNCQIDRSVLEVEEKPKTYITTDEDWGKRIKKSDIGKVNSYDKVYLLEDNEQKARELFCEKLRSDICTEKGRIESANERISEYENLIKELLRED